MIVISPSVTTDEFALLVRHAGLVLDDEHRASLYGVYGHLEAMLALNRSPHGADRPRGAEPSHIFVADQGWDL